MTINECINKYYDYFSKFAKRTDVIIADGKSNDDVVHDMMVMALKKWGDRDIEEQVLFDYLKKSIAMQLKMTPKKKNTNEIQVENIVDYEYNYSCEPDVM